jgi:hypothetical protein
VIGADGALSKVARDTVRGSDKMPYVFAYHEIIKSPENGSRIRQGPLRRLLQWKALARFLCLGVPARDTTSVGTGSANKGFSLKGSVAELRKQAGLDGETIRREGAPIPLKPLKRWDNGRDVVLAGDAAGVVAPASGEGIYYAMLGGRLAADAAMAYLRTGDARELATARKRFMKEHGKVFWVLGIMQYFWYSSDKRRESFVKMCADKDVQRLTWESYTEKKMVRSDPMAHVRISSRTWRIFLVSSVPHDVDGFVSLGFGVFGAGGRRGGGGGRRADGDRPLVPGAEEALLAAAGLGLRAGVDGDPGACRHLRGTGLGGGGGNGCKTGGACRSGRQFDAEHCLERHLLQDEAAGLGADRGGAAVALHRGADRGAGGAVHHGGAADGALSGVGVDRLLPQLPHRADEQAIRVNRHG